MNNDTLPRWVDWCHASIIFKLHKILHHDWWNQVNLTSSVLVLVISYHDDVIKWKHFPCYWPLVRGIHRSPVNSPHKGQWRGALMFSLVWAGMIAWVNNREAGDLRGHRAHYDVILMSYHVLSSGIPAPIRVSGVVWHSGDCAHAELLIWVDRFSCLSFLRSCLVTPEGCKSCESRYGCCLA